MARFESGYIKWHRSAYFGDIGKNIHCLGLWVALLTLATWKESKIIWKGEQRRLPPGSVVFGMRGLAEELECSKDTIQRWLVYLQQTDRLTAEHSPRGTLVTILNWDVYQGSDDSRETLPSQSSDARRTLVGRQPTLSEEGKKERSNTAESELGIRSNYSKEFEKAWEAFGRVGKKADAFKAFRGLKLKPEEYAHLLKAIPSYIADCRRNERKQQYFGTFLREDWRHWHKPPESAAADAANDQAGFEHIRKLNEQALARVKSGGAA